MNNTAGFIFDKNKCVGCHACVVACQVENDLQPVSQWRRVYSTTEMLPPKIPRFYLSLACNHCEHPACLDACPAAAFVMDQATGAVVLHQERCMGCRYCTWACPFDAPVFNDTTGLIEKCTFCVTRLREGMSPACATNCPTGALEFGPHIAEELYGSEPGIPETKLKPRIRFSREHDLKPIQIWPERLEERDPVLKEHVKNRWGNKVDMHTEWPLYVFTLCVPLLVGIYTGHMSGFLIIHPALFAGFLATAMLVSMLHLGRKTRALYVLRHFRTSWLSREILCYGVFSVLSLLGISIPVFNWGMAVAALVTGVFTLFTMDRVYQYFRSPFHSAGILLTGFMWIALILQEPIPLFFIIIIKAVLYIWRRTTKWNRLRSMWKWLSIGRLLLLVFIPAGIILFDNSMVLELFFPLVIGELIDRWEFYIDQQIVNPARELEQYEVQNIKQSVQMNHKTFTYEKGEYT